MPTFDNGEIGSSVRGKINTTITTVAALNTGDNLLLTASERAKLTAVEAGATADQTPAEIAAMVQDWRGVGNESLISATTSLEAASASGIADGNRGDISVSGGGTVWSVNSGSITNAKQATMADSTIKGRATGAGSGNPTDLTAAQVRTIIGVEDGATADQTPAEIASVQQDWRGAGIETLIAATSALQATASSGVPDGDKGDISVSGSGEVWSVDNNVVTNSKLADMAALSVKANPANSVSDPTDLQFSADGQVLTRSGTSLVAGQVQTAGVANSAVTNSKLSNVPENTLKGRISSGSGSPEDLTPAQARTLLNIANGATANASDAALRDRSTHTGTQAISTVAGLQAALDAVEVSGDVLNNYNASAAPTVNDDTGDGYAVGSQWITTSGANSGRKWTCIDATEGAAVWREVPLATDVSDEKSTLAANDRLLMLDSEDGNAPKFIIRTNVEATLGLTGLLAALEAL